MTPFHDEDEDDVIFPAEDGDDEWEDTVFRDEDEDREWGDTVYCGYEADKNLYTPCPHCGLYILEDAPRCRYCEQYIYDEYRARSNTPLWVITAAWALLATVIWWGFVAI